MAAAAVAAVLAVAHAAACRGGSICFFWIVPGAVRPGTYEAWGAREERR